MTTSGSLVDADLEEVAALGTRHVIDLAPRQHELSLKDEGEKLKLLGIGYTLIEVPFNKPTEQHYLCFVAALEQAPRPVHLHCVYNFRVSAFLYRYHIECGMDAREAHAIMREHWSPENSDHPAAQPWKAFIERTSQAHQLRSTG
ncbi:hypothetical protein [Pontixanthobacter luteolus]|nr:hypothetical protein [Pontixanthobacter luteolus]